MRRLCDPRIATIQCGTRAVHASDEQFICRRTISDFSAWRYHPHCDQPAPRVAFGLAQINYTAAKTNQPTANARQASDPHAMPLKEFIAESMQIITQSPDAPEILVERVKPLRFAQRGDYDAFFQKFNSSTTTH